MCDLDDFADTYNRMHGTKFKGAADMLEHLYKETKSTVKMGEILGISRPVVVRWMTFLGIGWPRIRGGELRCTSVLDGVKIDGRTARKIADEVGCHATNVYHYANKHGHKLKFSYRRRK